MKPLNADDPGCNYTSSNCVIWQGPDIPCLKLCKGDSVSDVVHKLATELCNVLDTLDVSNYDLACLNIQTCAPKNFQEFIQTLVNIICQLQSSGGVPGASPAAPSADTVIPVAPCFYYVNAFGDTVTTMTISDYVTAIGNRICNTDTRVTVVEITVATHTTQINDLQTQVSAIPTATEETVIPYCVLPAIPTSQKDLLVATEQRLCQLEGATGTASQIYAALMQQCAGLGAQAPLAGTGGTMSGIPGWENSLLNIAGAINNIWLTICDIRAAVKNIQLSCCPEGCGGVSLSMISTLAAPNLTIYLNGTISANFANCDPSGSTVTISDATGGSYTTTMDLITFLNNGSGYVVALPGYINTAADITVNITACLKDFVTGTTCQSVLQYTIESSTDCPSMIYTPNTTEIDYSGASITGTNTYTVQVWSNDGTTLIATQSQLITFPAPITGTFSGLSINTTFRMRVVVTPAVGSPTSCPFTIVALLPTVLLPLTLGVAGNFSVLGDTGVTNGAVASSFIGDVGTTGGLITNIVGGDVTGTLYAVADPAVLAANVAVVNALVAAAALPFVALPADDVSGTTITPGYWNGPTNTIVNNTNVTFDALGDPNAVFIVAASTTLTFANNATVTLINGATWDMIFWVINTTATIGTNCTFHGNLIASGNINIGNATTVDGRVLTDAASVTLGDGLTIDNT